MAQHMSNNDKLDRLAKQSSLAASAQAAKRHMEQDARRDSDTKADISSTRTESPDARYARLARESAHNPQSKGESDARSATSATASRQPGRHSRSSRTATPQRKGNSLPQFIRRNSVYILSVVAVILIIALMLVFLRGCVPQQGEPASEENTAYISPYDWTKLDRSDGRYAYIEADQVKSRLGIDVSENQQEIDWQAVADDGIQFAMIRLGYRGATEGDLYLDGYYQDYLAGAKEAGIDRGIYFFSQAQTVEEAVEEADFVLENLKGEKLEYPIAFDSEEAVLGLEEPRTSGLDDNTMTAIAEAFCNRVEAAGYRSLVYGNYADLSRFHYASMEDHDLWWAEYDAPVPTAQIDIIMWQYSNSGQVAGISTAVDMDIDLSAALG